LQAVIVTLSNVGCSWMLSIPDANLAQLWTPKSSEIIDELVNSGAGDWTTSQQMIKNHNNVLLGQENTA
jgi:hypothetical protein